VLKYILRRLGYMIIVLFVLSVVAFAIIQLPPGDYLTSYVAQLESQGNRLTDDAVVALRQQYGLDKPPVLQYFHWMGKLLRGDLGRSFAYNKPVRQLLAERLPLTILFSTLSLLLTYAIAIPIGIYSATHQYSLADYAFTFIGFVGLATPNFMFALILMFLFYKYFGINVGGLFSVRFIDAPMSWQKLLDILLHMPIPLIVIATAGTAWLIRVMRGCLLDELQKQYVVAALAKGLKRRRLLYKYPVRVAINPLVSTIGWTLPGIISGEVITSIVLNLPTTGPLLFSALLLQDSYLAGSTVMLLGFLTILGTLISDLLLVVVDPRIRFEKGTK
jgi:peptide/nickel transport system permease protein